MANEMLNAFFAWAAWPQALKHGGVTSFHSMSLPLVTVNERARPVVEWKRPISKFPVGGGRGMEHHQLAAGCRASLQNKSPRRFNLRLSVDLYV
eukprot:5805826-Amphidinium_carterae.1